jgi:HK97 family phage major capsid protein
MSEPAGLETKVIMSNDIVAYDGLAQAFEAFKETNDRRLGEIERRMTSDVVTTDKLARIEHTLDELAVKSRRPSLGGVVNPMANREHKAAFERYVRRGETRGALVLEEKAFSIGSGPDGGYLVPPETEQTVNRLLANLSPIRSIATVRQVSGSVYKQPFATSAPATGWVAETATRAQTGTPTLAELAFPTMELYAMPAATQAILDDSAVDIDQWIAEEVRIAFASQEGTAFVTGNGVSKPTGFLSYPTVANASWSWGSIGFLTTGVAGGFPASNPSDKLIDLTFALRAGYRQNGHFVMSRTTQSVIRKFKDADGNYLWQPSGRAGEPATLFGFPLIECEDMPAIGADSLSIAFGDFRRGYLVVDRIGIRVLRDPYSAKPYVLFYTTKRVGGGVQDFDAIKLLKFAV